MSQVRYIGPYRPGVYIGFNGLYAEFNAALTVPVSELSGLLGRSDFEAADEEAEGYVPVAPRSYGNVLVRDDDVIVRNPGLAEIPLSGGSGGAAAPNIVQAKQTSDFTVSGTVATMTQLGTIEPSITIAAGSRVRVRVSGLAGFDATPITMRASIDSGASFLLLGRRNLAPEGGSLDSEEIVSGLSAGAHTVKLEFTKGGTGIFYIRGASQPTLERLVIILEEIV